MLNQNNIYLFQMVSEKDGTRSAAFTCTISEFVGILKKSDAQHQEALGRKAEAEEKGEDFNEPTLLSIDDMFVLVIADASTLQDGKEDPFLTFPLIKAKRFIELYNYTEQGVSNHG